MARGAQFHLGTRRKGEHVPGSGAERRSLNGQRYGPFENHQRLGTAERPGHRHVLPLKIAHSRGVAQGRRKHFHDAHAVLAGVAAPVLGAGVHMGHAARLTHAGTDLPGLTALPRAAEHAVNGFGYARIIDDNAGGQHCPHLAAHLRDEGFFRKVLQQRRRRSSGRRACRSSRHSTRRCARHCGRRRLPPGNRRRHRRGSAHACLKTAEQGAEGFHIRLPPDGGSSGLAGHPIGDLIR